MDQILSEIQFLFGEPPQSVPTRQHPKVSTAIARGNDSYLAGSAISSGHHGEILQGVFIDHNGQLTQALVTLPCPSVSSLASIHISKPSGMLRVRPRSRRLALAAAKATFEFLGRQQPEGIVEIRSKTPVGYGLGSSTSDVVATIRAVASCSGTLLGPSLVARIAVSVERASDPTMFDQRCRLFAQRDGLVLDSANSALGRLSVLGFAIRSSPLATLDLPVPCVKQRRINQYEDLWRQLKRAVQRKDLKAIGQVATTSADLRQTQLPIPKYSLLRSLLEEGFALGLQISHSGSVGGFLFDSDDPNLQARMATAGASLCRIGFSPRHQFSLQDQP